MTASDVAKPPWPSPAAPRRHCRRQKGPSSSGVHEVRVAVGVEVAHRHGLRVRRSTRHGTDGRPEGAVAVAQQHADAGTADGVGSVARSRLPSLLKSPTASDRGPRPGGEVLAAPKPPWPSPSSTLTAVAAGVRRGQVELAVVVEVGRDHRLRIRADGVVVTGLKLGRRRSSRTSRFGRCVAARSEPRRP